jgi:hypothetical protein
MTRTNKRATNQLLRDSGEIKQTATVATTATTTKATLWYRHKTLSAERSGEKGVRLCSAVSLRGQNKVLHCYFTGRPYDKHSLFIII